MSKRFDVVVIGGGPGGTPAAMQLASRGKKVLLVESSGKLGGACLFVGCIPSKIIRHFAHEYHLAKNLPFSQGHPEVNVNDVWQRTRQSMAGILTGRSQGAAGRIRQLENLVFLSGTARFVSDNEVEIEDDQGGRSRYSFDKAIIATGTVPFVPPFEGNGVPDVLTSETLFKQEERPGSMVIVGGGPIGVELAQMFSRLDVKITVLEALDTILYGVAEPEFTGHVNKTLEDSGVDLFTSARVLAIDRAQRGFRTTFKDASGAERPVSSDQVLIATGRRPSVHGLNLEAAGVAYDRDGIGTDEYLETTSAGIYATGDVIKGPKFAHTATYEARIAAANILAGNHRKVDFAKNSWVLFTDPEVASAGLTEAGAAEAGYEVVTGTYDFRVDAAAQVGGMPFGYLKFVVDRGTKEIVGVHILAPGAGSIVGEGALIVAGHLTLMDVAETIHPHPTWTESFGLLALDMLRSMG